MKALAIPTVKLHTTCSSYSLACPFIKPLFKVALASDATVSSTKVSMATSSATMSLVVCMVCMARTSYTSSMTVPHIAYCILPTTLLGL